MRTKRTCKKNSGRPQVFLPILLLSILLGFYIPARVYLNNYTLFSVKLIQIIPEMLLSAVLVAGLFAGLAILVQYWKWLRSRLGEYLYLLLGVLLTLSFVAFVKNRYPGIMMLAWGTMAGLVFKKWEHKYVYLIYGVAVIAGLAIFKENNYPLITPFAWGAVLGTLLNRRIAPLEVFSDIVFGLALAIGVQVFLCNGGLEILSNGQPSWGNQSDGAILSLHLWGLCLVLPSVLRLIDSGLLCQAKTYGSAALTVLLLIVLLVRIGTADIPPVKVMTKEDEFVLSADENVVVFLVDSLDTQYVEDYILPEDLRHLRQETVEEMPEDEEIDEAEEIDEDDAPEVDEPYVLDETISRKLLKGFTYFDNVVSGGAPYSISVPTLLTGNLYSTDYEDMNQYYEEAFASSQLFRDLKKNGYGVKIYDSINAQYMQYVDAGDIENLRTDISYRTKSFGASFRNILRLTGYYASPFQWKRSFWVPGSDISDNVEFATPGVKRYGMNDPVYYSDFKKEGISLQDDEKCFVVYHLKGALTPYQMNEESKKVDKADTSQSQQIAGVFNIINQYVQGMKANGIYEDSTIIIAGTNGNLELGQNPAVFVKRKHEAGGFVRNSMPLTFENLRASLVDGIVPNAEKAYGYNMFDQPADEAPQLRAHVTDKDYWGKMYSDNSTWWREFRITDVAYGPENILKTVEFEPYPYELNQWISLDGYYATNDFKLTGLGADEDGFRWSVGNDITMSFQLEEPEDDVIFYMPVAGTVADTAQRVFVYVNDHLLFERTVTGSSDIQFDITKEVAPEGIYNIVIKLPDANSPFELEFDEDERMLALQLTSVGLYSPEEFESAKPPNPGENGYGQHDKTNGISID